MVGERSPYLRDAQPAAQLAESATVDGPLIARVAAPKPCEGQPGIFIGRKVAADIQPTPVEAHRRHGEDHTALGLLT